MSEQTLKVTINDASETRIVGALHAVPLQPEPVADPRPAEEPAPPKTKGGK